MALLFPEIKIKQIRGRMLATLCKEAFPSLASDPGFVSVIHRFDSIFLFDKLLFTYIISLIWRLEGKPSSL